MERLKEGLMSYGIPVGTFAYNAITNPSMATLNPLNLVSELNTIVTQYNELLKDAENAMIYYIELKDFLKSKKYNKLCNHKQFEIIFKDFETLLFNLQNDGPMRKLFEKSIKDVNKTLEDYDKSKDVQTYMDKIKPLVNQFSLRSNPAFTRLQLSYMINRINTVIDSISLEPEHCVSSVQLHNKVEPQLFKYQITKQQGQQFARNMQQIKINSQKQGQQFAKYNSQKQGQQLQIQIQTSPPKKKKNKTKAKKAGLSTSTSMNTNYYAKLS